MWTPQRTAGAWASSAERSRVPPVQYFDANGVEAYILPLPTCEANKSFDLVFEVARHLEIFRLNRCAGQTHA